MEFTAKTLSDAITDACTHFTVSSDRLVYTVKQEATNGFLGLNAKPCIIEASVKDEALEDVETFAESKAETKSEIETKPVEKASKAKKLSDEDMVALAKKFLDDTFAAMKMTVNVDIKYDADEKLVDVDLSGDEMGVLIGKRGQTLDSLQYLLSLVVNRESNEYIRVKLDTENYRKRRKDTLENLAKNISYKVKRTKRPIALEPMNPYERRIIHSALQNDRYVTTHSEGEEPFRRVVVTLKR